MTTGLALVPTANADHRPVHVTAEECIGNSQAWAEACAIADASAAPKIVDVPVLVLNPNSNDWLDLQQGDFDLCPLGPDEPCVGVPLIVPDVDLNNITDEVVVDLVDVDSSADASNSSADVHEDNIHDDIVGDICDDFPDLPGCQPLPDVPAISGPPALETPDLWTWYVQSVTFADADQDGTIDGIAYQIADQWIYVDV